MNKEIQESNKKENESEESKQKKYFQRHKRWIITASLILITLIIATGFYLHFNNQHCSGSFCDLTGNIIASKDNSPIVAEFNGEKITLNELDKDYNIFFFSQGFPESYKAMISKDSYLNQTIAEELLYLEALKENKGMTDKNAETSLENALLSLGLTFNELKKKLENKSIEYNDFLDFYKKQIVINEFLNKTLLQDIQISDQEVKDYYTENKDLFQTPAQIRASHILVNSSKEAEDIIEKLNDGANFSELAEEYSIGPSAKNGGDLGFFSRGQMVPEFENAVFALKKIGDYTQAPVKTQYGYHIIEFTGEKESKTLTFEEAKKDIEQEIITEKQKEIMKDYINKIKENSNIKIYEDKLK